MKFTIGRKIVTGFSLAIAIAIAITVTAFLALGKAGRGLAQFSESSANAVLAANLESAMLALRIDVNQFLAQSDVRSIESYTKNADLMKGALAAAVERFSQDSARRLEVENAGNLFSTYNAAFQKIVTATQRRDSVAGSEMYTHQQAVGAGLKQLLLTARQSGDQSTSALASGMLQNFFESVAAANMFLLHHDSADAAKSKSLIAEVSTQLETAEKEQTEAATLDASLANPAKTALLAQLRTHTGSFIEALDKVVGGTLELLKIKTNEIDKVTPLFAQKVADIRQALSDAQGSLDVGLRAAQKRTEITLTAISVTSIFMGIACSLFITHSVNRPIKQVVMRLADDAAKTASSAIQVSAASQSMADGSARQAAALEESSASLEEVSGMTRSNAANAQSAKQVANETRVAAESGSDGMREMIQAMDAIQASSGDISKIIKTIDEIAFQTNILALNAAVEAARAGEVGAGFAVVADEVRNLAQRSAQSARETAAKIEDSVQKSERGVQISRKVAQALAAIVEKTRKVDEIIAQIAKASEEQSQGIQQVNRGVSDMDTVTQANAATAEETSAASAELNHQTSHLKSIVEELSLMVDGRGSAAFAASPDGQLAPVHDRPIRSLNPVGSAAQL